MPPVESGKLSRREFAKIAASFSVVASTAVFSPQAHKEAVHHPDDTTWRRRALEAIAKFDIPMATEPGFVFRP